MATCTKLLISRLYSYAKEAIDITSALVTGANGFIGQHLVNVLEGHGFKVNTLVRNSRNYNIIGNVNLFEGNIFDTEVLGKAVDNVEIVFHLVAKTHDLSGIDNAKDYFRTNVEGTRSLLDVCSVSKIKHFNKPRKSYFITYR